MLLLFKDNAYILCIEKQTLLADKIFICSEFMSIKIFVCTTVDSFS